MLFQGEFVVPVLGVKFGERLQQRVLELAVVHVSDTIEFHCFRTVNPVYPFTVRNVHQTIYDMTAAV